MPETQALDIAINGDTAYLACGTSMSFYDITDKDYPEKINGFDLGKADKVITKENYVYTISADEDLKVIDAALNEVVVTKTFQGAEGFTANDITISGNDVYIAKDTYGIICFDIASLVSPSENGEFYISGTAMKEVDAYNRDRLFALGYLSSSDTYDLIYLDPSDPTLMTELWSHSFAQGLDINSMCSNGNRVFMANEDGVDVIVSPLEDAYTVEVESELIITVYSVDPDGDPIRSTINNKPDFAEAVFSYNGSGTATFTWTPTKDQIGVYGNISFTANDSFQQVASGPLIITVVQKDTNRSVDETPILLLHSDGDNGSTTFIDSSNNSHSVIAYGGARISTSAKKWGSGSLMLDGRGDYLKLADSSDWDVFGSTSDSWTIDFWVKHTDHAAVEYYVTEYLNNDNRWAIWHGGGNGLRVYFKIGGALLIDSGYAGVISDTDWHHVALCKSGSDWGVYLDGTQVDYFSLGSSGTFAGALYVGAAGSIDSFFDGYMDELKIQHSNTFNASPNSGKTDTIAIPEVAY